MAFRQNQDTRRLGGSVARIPGWLVFVIFVPLQIWLFIHLFEFWRYWTILFVMLLGFLGNRAARAPWLTEMIFPNKANRHEARRHVFQGILFLAGALAWLLHDMGGAPAWVRGLPYPWVPLAFAVTLLKAALR